jgi:hypothetical protein
MDARDEDLFFKFMSIHRTYGIELSFTKGSLSKVPYHGGSIKDM